MIGAIPSIFVGVFLEDVMYLEDSIVSEIELVFNSLNSMNADLLRIIGAVAGL